MQTFSPQEALERLFEAGVATLQAGDRTVEVTALSIVRDTVSGTAPRLHVAEGMRLTGRAGDDDGEPWLVTLELLSTEIRSRELAGVRLRVVAVYPHPRRRRERRSATGGRAHADAVNCRDIPDGLRIGLALCDLSTHGVGFTTDARLAVGDRVTIHIRRIGEEIDADLRVVLVRPADHGRHRVGASIIEISAEHARRLAAMLAPAASALAPAALDLHALRAAESTAGGWSARLRRTA